MPEAIQFIIFDMNIIPSFVIRLSIQMHSDSHNYHLECNIGFTSIQKESRKS
jgi:hypothetical protein